MDAHTCTRMTVTGRYCTIFQPSMTHIQLSFSEAFFLFLRVGRAMTNLLLSQSRSRSSSNPGAGHNSRVEVSKRRTEA